MKEQYGCGFLFVCLLYLVFAVLVGGIATFVIQFLISDYFGAYMFALALDIMLFVAIAVVVLWDREFKGYGNRILALLTFLISCVAIIVVGNSLYHDFAFMFPNGADFDKDAIEMGRFILWFQMTQLSASIGFAVLSSGALLLALKTRTPIISL